MADRQDKHEKAMAQRVGNLPADMLKVREQISANTKQQLNTVERMNEVKFDIQQTDRHIGDMQDLVTDLRHKTVGSVELLEENKRLASALQEERISSRTNLALLELYKAQLHEDKMHRQMMQQREERFLAEIDRLRSELAELRSHKPTQEESARSRKETGGGLERVDSQYADLVEASRNPNWISDLARPGRHSK